MFEVIGALLGVWGSNCCCLVILHVDCCVVVVGVWGVLCENCIVDASIFILVEEFFDCKFA